MKQKSYKKLNKLLRREDKYMIRIESVYKCSKKIKIVFKIFLKVSWYSWSPEVDFISTKTTNVLN